MKFRYCALWLIFILLLLTSPCSAYTLKSGVYIMSITLADQDKAMPQRVLVKVKNGKVEIANETKEGVFTGKLRKNELIIYSQQKDERFEFTGELVANNKVEGSAVQTSKNRGDIRATFTLIKAK